LDTEWLLSTLFDASLLLTFSRRQRRLFFRQIEPKPGLGNHILSFMGRWLDSCSTAGNDLFIISRPGFGSFGALLVPRQTAWRQRVKHQNTESVGLTVESHGLAAM
jgi:hypothetical protein